MQGMFLFTRFAISEYVEMLTKVANYNIYLGCLVPLFSSFEAEQYGEGIMKTACQSPFYYIKDSFHNSRPMWKRPIVYMD